MLPRIPNKTLINALCLMHCSVKSKRVKGQSHAMHSLVYSPVPWTLVGPWWKGGIYQFGIQIGLLEGGDFVAPSTLPNRSVRSRPAAAKVSCIYFLHSPTSS